ncbi:MAG: type I glutamate--ammonia ligase [Candidatus Bathyarchaeia archaeon]
MRHFKDAVWRELVNKVINIIQEQKIKFARLQFIDINGIPKSLSVSTKRIETLFDVGQAFDGSSVTGYRPIEESDLVLNPDPSTFALIPWRKEEKSSCRFICDIYTPEDKRFEGDPRYILEKALEKCHEEGVTFKCAPEMEFFIFKEEHGTTPTPIDIGGYFDIHPGDLTEDLRREIADEAEAFGIDIEIAHHEVALGQNEIDFRYDEALETADRTVTMKIIVKNVASRNGYIATFMPKPFYGVNGSGMHVHQSIWSLDGKNLFYSDDESRGYLSDIALHFIGGQLAYGREMCAILASWPNSYKRLVPGYEAPVYIAWGYRNRSPLIRVPNFGRKSKAARVEIRCPDPAGNPYLQFAVLCMTGLEGIKKKIEPPEPTDLNVYSLSYEDRKKLGITSLPESLKEALDELEKSELMKRILGDILFENFVHEKRKEWDLYRAQVTNWEIERYLRRL